ncbi:uncharacterized protein LOC117823392 [Notolabrus celidotus]|uniref:uncharacterized protein LOC117823392 n=1 Tax=Notolabrus celidotus TaxID=1203425 RepID=UPI00148F9C66|nr:uncharacterized protein LOC117823392 [Notolabrus celidotus]
MNLVINNALQPLLRDDEALVVENSIRLAIDSIVNVLNGVNSARTREYQRTVADRDKEIQKLERRLGESEHELQVLRRQGCACRLVKKEHSPVTGSLTLGDPLTSGDPQEGEQGGLEPSCMNTEMTTGQQECDLSFSLGLFTRPPSHVSSQSHESALPSSPSRLGLDQTCTPHSSESSGVSDAARNQTTSPSSSVVVKEEPCEIDTVFIKWEMSEERITEAPESTSGLCPDKESPDVTKILENRRKFKERPHTDSGGHNITEAENLRFMSSIGNEIKDIILKALPGLSEDTQQQVISTLQTLGVESLEDLKYVRQDGFNDLLPVTQQRKLLEAFKMETPTVTLDLQSLPVEPAQINLSPLSSPLDTEDGEKHGSVSQEATPRTSRETSRTAIIPSTWPEHFEVPWHKMPEELRSAIANNKRPAPDKRRQMIRILVDEMKKYVDNPKRKEYMIICRNIVKQYPSSFADMTRRGVIIAGGFFSLLSQVKRRIENINRASLKEVITLQLAKRLRQSAFSYGCKQFQPGPPPEETSETVEQKRQQLQSIYRQEGADAGERAEVINLMKTTFCLQRSQINQTPSAFFEDLRNQWPYLFTERGIFCHFELLTDINVSHALELFIEECGQRIEKYLKTKSKRKDRQHVVYKDGELTLRIIQLLMGYFGEKTEGLILPAHLCATAADVESNLTLPASPRLILLMPGDEVTVGRWMISIEGHVICEGRQQSFISGLAALFATYYVFNLQYQEEAAKTLEFIQRRFIGINPERGSKANHKKGLSKKTGKLVQKKIETVNPKVATLLKNLTDFEWGFV